MSKNDLAFFAVNGSGLSDVSLDIATATVSAGYTASAVVGYVTVPTYPGYPDENPYGFFDYGTLFHPVSMEMRGTGNLNPLKLADFPCFDFAPWCARVLDPDILMGRRGVAGGGGYGLHGAGKEHG